MATKQEILSKLAASHEQRISKVLFDLEEDIIAQLQRATDGVPLTTELAIQLRPNLKQLIEQNYLKEGSRIISEYDEVVKGYMDYIRTTPVSDKFKTLTKPDLKIINQLKQLSFSGFEDVANRFLDTIATEIYSSAVTGKPFPQVVENIRASINGVYRRSNEAAVNRLVAIVEENRYSDDPVAKKKYLDARKILHSKYASDIRGENMRKYANQIAHDSIMQFDGQFTKYKGQEAGINTYKYTGTNITTTRQFCRAYLNEIKTEEEWREVFTGNWRGKSGSDPFVNRGGYRCRHSLIPYDPAWDDIEEVQAKVQPKATDIKTSADVATNVSSLANKIKIDDIQPVAKVYLTSKLAKQFELNRKDNRYVKDKNGNPIARFEGGVKNTLLQNLDNLDNLTLGAIEAVFQELDDLAVKYNIPKIRAVYTSKKKKYIAGMGDGSLLINPKYLTVTKEIKKKATRTIDPSGFAQYEFVKNSMEFFDNDLDRLRAALYHEFGHHIHQQKFINKAEMIKTNGLVDSTKLENKLDALERTKAPTSISANNSREWFAENFSLYEMGLEDATDPVFIKFLKEEVID